MPGKQQSLPSRATRRCVESAPNLSGICLQASLEQYQNSAFQLIRNEGRVAVLPLPLLEELSRLPPHVAQPTAVLEGDLSEDWTEFQPYKALSHVSGQLGAEAIVGPTFCDNENWLHIPVEYTENLLRCVPAWLRAVLSRFLPSYWEGWRLLCGGQKLLGPKIQGLLDKNNAGVWQKVGDNPEDLNVLSWLTSLAKGRDRNADIIGHVLVKVALAAVHTTLLRMVNVPYDAVDAGAELQTELLDQIAAVARRGWHDPGNPYNAKDRLDKVLGES
ncbi:hypothetical protein DL769_008047 [Monosporascus sp. CRB-8-3]|nr:hypothetical protein DL769_008047 [Monosporascus sp. CRB-8-3]